MTDADDVFALEPRQLFEEGSDQPMNLVDRSLSQGDWNRQVCDIDDDDDKILFICRQFGCQITFEHARTRRQRRRFQQSEADFVFFDRGAQPGADSDLSSRLFYNANGSKPGWGDAGGLFINFRNGFDLTLSDLASF